MTDLPARRSSSALVIAMITALFLGPTAGASDVGVRDDDPRLSAGADDLKGQLDGGLRRLLDTREEAEKGSISAAVAALERLGEAPIPPVPFGLGMQEAQSSTTLVDATPTGDSAERSFAEAVKELKFAIDVAKQIRARAMRKDPSYDDTAASDPQRKSVQQALKLLGDDTGRHLDFSPRAGPVLNDSVRDHLELLDIEFHIPRDPRGDRGLLLVAARVVAEAIDDSILSLRKFVEQRPPTSGVQVKGCDVVDQSPTVCIGGMDNNRYTKDAELLIDLGGDDTYLNSAGGADPLLGNGIPISIAIDLTGNDKYRAVLPLSTGARIAQGAAAEGGIGILADLEGNDSYSITATPTLRPPQSLGTVGQGAAHASGVGLLYDFGGDDAYNASSHAVGERSGTLAQGAAFASAAGALVDHDGDDLYRATTRPRNPARPSVPLFGVDSTSAVVAAMGAGLGGALGLLGDFGGDDSLKLSVNQTLKVSKRDDFQSGMSTAVGLGAGFGELFDAGGAGALLLGPGRAKATATAGMSLARPSWNPDQGPPSPSSPPDLDIELAVASTLALGMGSYGGFGGLSDAGGNDRYVARNNARDLKRAPAASALSAGIGFGSFGTGVVHEADGNDSYMLEAEARSLLGSSSFAGGEGAGVGGVGGLYDEGGDDSYHATSRAHNRVSEKRIGRVNVLHFGEAVSGAQAFGELGLGVMVDSGGADSYTTDNGFWLGGRSLILGAASFAQASVSNGFARFEDVDKGARDAFRSSPPNPTCQGTRGKSTWQDCGAVYGEGSVRSVP